MDYIGDYDRGYLGCTRSLDYSSCARKFMKSMLFPNGPCRYMAYTLGPRGSHILTLRLKAQVHTI